MCNSTSCDNDCVFDRLTTQFTVNGDCLSPITCLTMLTFTTGCFHILLTHVLQNVYHLHKSSTLPTISLSASIDKSPGLETYTFQNPYVCFNFLFDPMRRMCPNHYNLLALIHRSRSNVCESFETSECGVLSVIILNICEFASFNGLGLTLSQPRHSSVMPQTRMS